MGPAIEIKENKGEVRELMRCRVQKGNNNNYNNQFVYNYLYIFVIVNKLIQLFNEIMGVLVIITSINMS